MVMYSIIEYNRKQNYPYYYIIKTRGSEMLN